MPVCYAHALFNRGEWLYVFEKSPPMIARLRYAKFAADIAQQSSRWILPFLLDLEGPVECQMCDVVVIHEAGSGVVLAANEHAGWGLLGLESLFVHGLLFGVWAVRTLERIRLAKSSWADGISYNHLLVLLS